MLLSLRSAYVGYCIFSLSKAHEVEVHDCDCYSDAIGAPCEKGNHASGAYDANDAFENAMSFQLLQLDSMQNHFQHQLQSQARTSLDVLTTQSMDISLIRKSPPQTAAPTPRPISRATPSPTYKTVTAQPPASDLDNSDPVVRVQPLKKSGGGSQFDMLPPSPPGPAE